MSDYQSQISDADWIGADTMTEHELKAESELPATNGSARDPRIDWHIKQCRVRHATEVSELAVRLALAASERGNSASYEWEAYNAMRFEAILANERKAPNNQAQRLG